MSADGMNGKSRRREVWVGHDSRQPMAYNTMRYSIERNASAPIAVRGLFIDQLPITRTSATEFTYSRFLVPWLMDFEGIGIFTDEDMVVVGDIWELFGYCSKLKEDWDVAVFRDQPRFEWASVMVTNNARLKHLTPEFIENPDNKLFDMAWAKNVVDIPAEWNHCAGMMEPKEAKLYHWSQGIPCWKETRGLPEDHIWFDAYQEMNKTGEWMDFHSNTIHYRPVMRRFLKKYNLSLGDENPDYGRP